MFRYHTRIFTKGAIIVALLWSVAVGAQQNELLVNSIGGTEALKAVAAMKTIELKGDIRLNELKGRFRVSFMAPDKLHFRLELGSVIVEQSYDGRIAWQRDINGSVSELSGYERNELMQQVYLQSFSYILKDRMPGRSRYDGEIVFDGNRYNQFYLIPEQADSIRLLLDIETDQQRLLISYLDNLEIRTSFSDYRLVDSVLVPFHSTTKGVGTPLETEYWLKTVRANVEIDTALFSKPSIVLSDYFFPSNKASVSIPFQLYNDHIYVEGRINSGKKVRFILDSGASSNILNKSVADRFDLQIVGSFPAKGVAGYEDVSLVRTDSIQVGELTIFEQVAGVLDFEMLGIQGDSLSFGGVIGYDFLSRFPILIDYSEKKLIVYNPVLFERAPGGTELPFTRTSQVPTVKVSVAGVSGEFIVDIGNGHGLILHGKFVESNQLFDLLKNLGDTKISFGGVGGSVMGQTAVAPTVRLGDRILENIPVLISMEGDGILSSEAIAGNIGNPLLSKYRVLFDYKENMIVLYDY